MRGEGKQSRELVERCRGKWQVVGGWKKLGLGLRLRTWQNIWEQEKLV
jgi:hypothetical protein